MRRLLPTLVVAFASVILLFGPATTLYFHQRQAVAECHDRQRGYDGQIFIVRFIGHELHASETRIDEALDHLRQERGPRPEC